MRNHFLRAATDTGPPSSNAWDIGFAEFTATPQNWFNVTNEDSFPFAVFFKPDGTVMYILGSSNDSVYQYSLSTAWDVSTASYSSKFFDVGNQETLPYGLFFKPDGTKMYVVGRGADTVFQYDLSTAWDVSTASYSTVGFSVTTQESNPQGLFFKDDGTEMYVIGYSSDAVQQYTLSTAWDLTTASFSQSFSVATQETTPKGVVFGDSGTKMYVAGSGGDDVNEYSLSTAWDISTASYSTNFSIRTQAPNVESLQFKSDGSAFYVVDSSIDAVYQYSLSTAWDISTASFTYPSTDYYSVVTRENSPTGIFFKPDGTKMYILGNNGDDVNEFSLSTAWQISTASYVQNFSVSAQDVAPYSLFFKPDGTKMYILGNIGDDVNEYSLSTAWDVSTASYVQNFSVSAQDTVPSAVFFKDDGTKMYVTGIGTNRVYEYSLSTAWDISTASYDQSFATNNGPTGLFFKDDGSTMYVCDYNVDRVTSYSLSSAWDISTASSVDEFSLVLYDGSPRNIFFKPDGTKMFTVGTEQDAVWAFDLT
jgi:DNA-binding beta-propeller fold protein YncE